MKGTASKNVGGCIFEFVDRNIIGLSVAGVCPMIAPVLFGTCKLYKEYFLFRVCVICTAYFFGLVLWQLIVTVFKVVSDWTHDRLRVRELLYAADNGDADALYALACDYYRYERLIRYCFRNTTTQIEWYRKAAENGNAKAQHHLGEYYSYGPERNKSESLMWYRKAAEQGYADAQLMLSCCYADGDGVEMDETVAVMWCRKAAEQGYAHAQIQLGKFYASGCGVEQDETEAVKWYRNAAEQGCADAQYILGRCYAFGHGVEKDSMEAMRLYRQAAENGCVEAQFQLCWCYHYGIGVMKNESEAAKWYRKSAKKDAFYLWGKIYRFADEAVIWCRMVAEHGHVCAQ